MSILKSERSGQLHFQEWGAANVANWENHREKDISHAKLKQRVIWIELHRFPQLVNWNMIDYDWFHTRSSYWVILNNRSNNKNRQRYLRERKCRWWNRVW
jgi:hypothetical protein